MDEQNRGYGDRSLYSYRPLSHENSIRILKLAPGRWSDLVKVNIVHVRLSKKPKYRAISYTWGGQKLDAYIECDGLLLPTTENALSALVKARDEEKETAVWIDSICINQQDLLERGHQVGIMSDIYRRACEVLICLDGRDKHAEAAFNLLETVHSSFKLLEIPHYPNPPREFFTGNYASLLSQLSGRNGSPLRKVFRHQWFRRTWVLQEVGLSRHAILLCGKLRIEWDKVVFMNAFLKAQREMTFLALRIECYPVTLMTKDFWQHAKIDFLELLALVRECSATDPRDAIFALLSHPAASKMPIKADYRKSVAEVCREVASILLHSASGLRILSHVQYPCIPEAKKQTVHQNQGGTPSATDGLPTWVPKWNDSLPFAFSDSRLYSATKDIPASFHLIIDATVLSIEGISFNTIVHQSHILQIRTFLPIPNRPCDPNYANAVINIWTELRSSSRHSHSPTYPTGVPNWQAYCDTLTANNFSYSLDSRSSQIVPGGDTAALMALLYRRWETTGVQSLVPQQLDDGYTERVSRADTDEERALALFQEQAALACSARRLFVTSSGYYGLGPETMEPGDRVCVLFGANVPFVLRRAGRRWRLVGECYVHGIMDGEAVDMWREGKLRSATFEIE